MGYKKDKLSLTDHVVQQEDKVDCGQGEGGVSMRATTGVSIQNKSRFDKVLNEHDEEVTWDIKHDVTGKLADALSSRVRLTSNMNRNKPKSGEDFCTKDKTNWSFFTDPPDDDASTALTDDKKAPSSRNIDSKFFRNFSFQDALDFLGDNPQFPFLHVTSGIFLPLQLKKTRENKDIIGTYYDVRVLGIPGTDKSGSLKSKTRLLQESLLKNNQLMQLSLQGLLYTAPESERGEFVDLKDFKKEREWVAALRRKCVFRQFLERKVMALWKRYVGSKVFRTRQAELSTKMLMSNTPILHAVQRIRSATYLLEASTELYAFHQPGSIGITEYVLLQKKKIDKISFKLRNLVENLAQHLQGVYEKLTAFEYVSVRMKEIFRAHPYSTTMQEVKATFDNLMNEKNNGNAIEDKDWKEVRSVQRLLHEQKTCMQKVLRMGQYMVENALLRIIYKFWNRLSESIYGLHDVSVVSVDGEDVAMWGTTEQYEEKYELSAHRRPNASGNNIQNMPTDHSTIPKKYLSYERKPYIDIKGTLANSCPQPKYDTSGDEQLVEKISKNCKINEGGNFSSSRHKRRENEVILLSSGALTGQADNYFVSEAWQQQGSYMSIDAALVYSSDPNTIVATSRYTTWSLNDVKIRGIPDRVEMVNKLHLLYHALGQLLDDTPNLIRKQFMDNDSNQFVESIRSPKIEKVKVVLSDEEILRISDCLDDDGELCGNENNRRYFNNLKSSAILSSPELFEIAIRCMHQFRAAYSQSVDMDSALERLQETFRKIWTVSPDFICHQLDRSGLLPMLRDMMDCDSSERLTDLEAVLARDKSKISSLKQTISLLNDTKSLQRQYQDIKNSLGFITSFKTIVSQIEDARHYKTTTLFSKLPQTCITRMNSINLFVRQLKSYFQNESQDMSNVIFLLQKLKNFDDAKDLLETEFDICCEIYDVLVKHEKAMEDERIAKELRDCPENTANTLHDDIPAVKVAEINFGDLLSPNAAEKAVKRVRKKRRPEVAVITIHTSYQVHTSERDSLFEVVSKCRMFLLYRLRTASEEIKNEITQLHKDIIDLTALVTECNVELPIQDVTSAQDTPDNSANAVKGNEDKVSVVRAGEVYGALSKCKFRITQIRESVEKNMRAQRLMIQSHMIIGAADCFFDVIDMDNFVDMDDLERFFNLKYRSCSSILEASVTIKKLLHSKLVMVDMALINKKYHILLDNRKYLMDLSTGDNSVACLTRLCDELYPMLQVAAFFKSKFLKFRHWERMNKKIMHSCNLEINMAGPVSDNISLSHIEADGDMHEKITSSLGTLRSQQLKTLLDHGVTKHMDTLKSIAADACIEAMIEKTLEAVEHAMKTIKVVISLDWLEDKIFRNKIFFQLHRITNCIQVSVSIRYCLKALTICEHTAFDMAIEIFDDKIHFIRLMLQDMYILINRINIVQKKWIAVFHYIKFTTSGEIERETERYFQQCTEEIKKIEVAVESTTNATFYSVFNKLHELNFAIDTVGNALTHVEDDINNLVQSMLDGYPRLSMLPYHRTKKLIRAWLVNPQDQMGVITRCISDLFPAVGKLTYIKDDDSALPIVQGICSHDGNEVLNFSKGIRMEVSLDEFLKAFEYELRAVVALHCDALVVEYIEHSRQYFLDHRAEHVLETVDDCFAIRLNPTLNASTGGRKAFKPNQCVVLVNMAIFAEHMWFCLGYATGTVEICRPDFTKKNTVLSKRWRDLLKQLNTRCKQNVRVMQLELQEGHTDEKTRKLYVSLLQQEISFIQCVDEILCCPCLESAVEQWAGRYQIRFLYEKDERWQSSPFEVTLGCVGVPYGLEYQGTDAKVAMGHTLERALQKVIGSAFVSKGTVFVSQESESTPTESIGEYSISCSDVADALGRIYLTLSSVKCEGSVRFFLTRLCVLDAVGCIDFANLDHDDIQMLMGVMTKMWTSIEKKDDQYIAKGLKYPMKLPPGNSFTNAVQNSRQKNTMMKIRQNFIGQGKSYSGIFVVGLASESLTSGVNLLDYFAKSIFNTVAVNYNRPVENLGLMLCTKGFKYGYLLQLIMQEVIYLLHEKYSNQDSVSYLSSSLLINTVVSQCTSSLIRTRISLNSINRVLSDQELLRVEVECLYNVMLEQVVLLGQCAEDELREIHKEVHHVIQMQLNTILDKTNRFYLSDTSFFSEVVVSFETKTILNRALRSLSLLPGGQFLEQCSVLWKAICGLQSMVIVSGPAGCGKSSLIHCTIEALRNEGAVKTSEISNLIAMEHWRAARTLVRVVKKWLSLRKSSKNPGKIKDSVNASKAHLLVGKSRFSVRKSLIHHASLPTESLIGRFDDNGQWFDGILVRKLRRIDEDSEKEINLHVDTITAQIVVLDGPIGSNLEQLFTHSTYSAGGRDNNEGGGTCKLVFPTGEKSCLHKSVAIVLETSDLSNASPTLLMHTPHVHCGVSPFVASRRLLTVWLRSICNWLRPYPSWIEPVNEINRILLRTDFIKELLTCDYSAIETNAITCFSRMSTFIRYLEELLQQCHELIITSTAPQNTGVVGFNDTPNVDGSESESSEFDTEEGNEIAVELNEELMQELSLKEVEKLKTRTKLSLLYAAVWGLGGGANGTQRRVFFDRIVKDAVEKYIGKDLMDIQENVLMFDLILDLPQCCFVQGLSMTPQIRKSTRNTAAASRSANAFVDPWSLNRNTVVEEQTNFDSVPMEARIINAQSDGTSLPELRFHSPSSKAVMAAFELLLKGGGNVLCVGNRCTGKKINSEPFFTFLILEQEKRRLLKKYCLNMGRIAPTPSP